MHGIKIKALSFLCLIFFSFLHCSISGHGFASNTLVRLDNESLQAIHAICLRALHKSVLVISYDAGALCTAHQYVKTGRRSKSNCYMRLGFDVGFNDTTQNDIVCTPMQEFYLPQTHQWVPVYTLKVGDALCTKDMATKQITYIQFIEKPLTAYTLEIENTHTFFVGKYSILTHNMLLPLAASIGITIPFGSVATGAIGSFFGSISMIGGIVVGGIVSIAIKAFYENRILRYQIPTYNIAFIKAHRENAIKPVGCFNADNATNKIHTQVFPLEDSLPKQQAGCIEIDVAVNTTTTQGCGSRSDESKIKEIKGCFESVEPVDSVSCYSQDKVSANNNDEGRYDGPKARNWKEFETNCPVGQKHGKKFINIGKQNPKDGSPLRKLSEDIPNAEMFKRGWFVALDKFHEGDHMEVWDKDGNWIGVANLDGSKNYQKSNAEKNRNKRNIKKII